MKKQFQSKSVPRGTRTIWRYLGALFILFTFAIGNVWATAHSITPNKTGTNYEIYQIAHQNNQSGTVIKSKQSTFNAEFTSWCSGSIYDYTGSTPTIPSAIADNWLTQTTKGAKVRQPGLTFEVTNCVGVTILGKANGSGDTKKWTLSVKSGGVEVGTVASDNTTSVHELSYGTTLSATETYTITVASSGASSNIELYQIRFEAPATTTKYSVTYKAGDGTGDDVVDDEAEAVKTFAACGFTAPSGYEFKEWQDAGSTVVDAGDEVQADMTLTAIYRLIPTKYTVTYSLNGASGDAPTETDKAAGDAFNLAAAPSWAGHAFDGWLCSADAAVKAAGASYTMTAANTTFTAQWHEVDCKIFSLTGGIGSAEIVADESNASISAESLVLKGSNAIIKLTPAAGETFKAGDVVTISGTVGNAERNFGVKISNTNDKKATLGTISVAGNTVPMIASGALTGNADYLYLVRDGGTTQTMLTFEVHRACAEGAAAGLSYANATVNKLTTDAAFTNALTNTNGLVIAGYTSSNAEVATVDKNGQVTLVGAGEATITAHSAIQTKAGTLYAAGTASYTLTVATPPTFEVTYAANGGEGTMTDANTYLEGAEVTLLDNTFTAPTNKIFGGWVATYNDGTEKTLTITNGKFTMPAYDVTVTAQWVDDNKVAKIGETYYTSLEGAEGAFANVADGQTIELLKNCDVTSQLEIAAGVTATIDLNGHKIEYVGDATLPSGVILVHNGASLTINDSNDPSAGSIVSGDKAYAAVALTKLGDDASTPATLVVNGGALTGYYYGITGNGSRNNTDITINGGTITGTVGIAIYHPQVGTLTVNDGSLTGVDAAIEMRAGTLVINDGTFTATATEFSCNPNGSGSTTSGAAIAIAQHTTKKEISVTINGGTFNGVKALNESNPQVNDPAPEVAMEIKDGDFNGEVTTVDVNNFISGGTFDHEVAANQCAENYAPKDNGDGTYGVKPLAQTFSLEDLVTNQGTGANYTTYLNNLGWTVASADALDKLNTDKDYDNYPYLGLKFKNAAGYVAGEVEGGKLLTIKLGHMAGVAHLMVDDVKKMELDGVDAETPKVHYYYVENTANVKLLMANAGSSKTCVLKAITVADPFTVTFDANGGEAVASLNGTPTVTLPSATKGTDSFLGWFDGETKVGEAGDTYTPTANITLVAHWEAVSTDARLASISFSSDAGTLSPAFDPEVTSYTYTMPYGTASVPTITGATAVNANAQAPVIGTAATAWGEAQTVKGVAQSGAEKIYTVTILRAPKDGVCIIKGNVGNNTFVIDEDASLFAGTADKNNVRENSSTYQEKIGWKFQSRPARLGLTLSGDETFQEGDVVEVFVTSVADIQGNNDKMRIFDATDATAAHLLYESEADMIQGANRFVLPATTTKSLYLHRTNEGAYDNFNPFVAYVAVYRAMNPVLTAITINGVACDKGEGNAFSVTLPNGTNLGSLTVVPTIVKNGEGGSAAPTAAWAWENNTYRVTDKDGDYTDYTITLTEAAAPSAAPVITAQPEGADYIEGASIAALEVVATGSGELSYQWYLGAEAIEGATAATYAPAVSAIGSYVYHCVVTNTEAGHPATSLASDNATITISENSNAIKLFDGEGNLNTTNFISPAKTTIEIADVEHVCLAEFSSNRSSLGGATPTDMVKYDVTTDKAKIQMTFYNNNSGTKKAILYKYEEGGTPEKIEIEVPGQQIFTTEYYEFNSSKNRTFYICMNDRSNIRVLQVKVIDNGANPVKQFGQVGYSLNLNKARFYAKAAVEKSFEGFTFTPSSDYKVYNNSNLATTSANSFTIASPTVMSVKRSGGKYYVYQDPADKGTLYSADAEIELNATGTWYISSETTSSAASFTKIEFLAPKCEKPTITTQPQTKLTFDPGDLTATVVAAEPTDGGMLSYQWYNAANDEEVEGATEATLTTTTPGTYYVVVTNTLAGHQDVSVTSEEAELGYRVTDDATLKSLKYGETAIALEDGVYEYDVNLAKGTTEVPALAATATMNGYATVTISNAAEFVNYEASSTVTVKSEDLTETNVYTVNFTVKHDLPQVDVTATTTWDMANVSASAINLKNDDPALDKQNARLLLANIDGVNNTTFNAQALMFEGQHIGRTGAGIKHLAGRYVQFNVTVPGAVFVTFESNGDNARTISINGKKCSRTTSGTAANDYITYALAVEPGSVEIIGYEGESANQYVRISKIEFKAEYSHRREKLNPSYLGTLCWTNNAVLGGATLYEFAGKNEYNYLVFDEVAENRLEAGKPYIFMPENGSTEIRVYNTDNEEPMTEIELEPVNHMYGTFTGKTLVPGENDNMYYFSASHIWAVKDFTVNITVPAYYCYVDYEAVLAAEPAPAPAHGRRRVTMGVQGQQVATGIEDVQGDKVQCTKMLINGQLFILRGEKMYDAKGQLVK